MTNDHLSQLQFCIFYLCNASSFPRAYSTHFYDYEGEKLQLHQNEASTHCGCAKKGACDSSQDLTLEAKEMTKSLKIEV